jgi:ubiquinone/menaquinone biosynthesis C-methylase UbiE
MTDPIWNQRIFYEFLADYASGRRWLDLGCGRGPNGSELTRVRGRIAERIYVGVDEDMDSLKDCPERNRVRADVKSLPFADGSFDLVTSDMVFEHLDDPVTVLEEAHRVLAREGVLIVHTASSLHYLLLVGRLLSKLLPRKTFVHLVSRFTGRKEEDVFPTRYRANTAGKFARAASKAGFLGGFAAYLETPLGGPGWARVVQRPVRKLLPKFSKSTLLALYMKRQWD